MVNVTAMLQILTPEGDLVGEPPVDVERTVSLYQQMIEARAYDRKGMALQKQGRLATYAPFEGQEAAQIGAAAPLGDDDWVVATYRDAALMWAQGYPWELLFLGRVGDERGGSPPDHVPVLPPSITVGGHMVHAVGLAWAARLLGEERIALTSFGDGATSEGDFHEAMNFAAVFDTPCVFLCQNNGYAISLPREAQTRSETIAIKADAYGVPGVQVDGNDLFAVVSAVTTARQSALAGAGPTLIEAVTYRLGPHTTADDPKRYRPDDEPDPWRERDPLVRARRYLEAADAWDEESERAATDRATETMDRAIELAEATPDTAPDHVFEGMFAEMPPHLRQQLGEARR